MYVLFQPVPPQRYLTGLDVYYNETVMSVTISTTMLSFTAPSLPDGMFTRTLVATVTTIYTFGNGPVSNQARAIITGKICTYVRM